VCDGIISCRIEGLDLAPAYARMTVAPPDYAPDRRPFVSMADGIKDKVARAEVFDADYLKDRTQVEREITDLMERILETMALVNVDVFNNRVDVQENPEIAFAKGIPYKSTDHYAFVPPVPIDGRKFPLTEQGRQFHRRFISIEVFKEMLRETPELIHDWIREPFSDELFFTKKMPPVMRDSSGGPLHLTRRQYDLLVQWSRKLRENVEGGS
jgi:hypothetical protein